MARTPYEVLGVGRDATDDELKKAYRDLVKKYHPDLYSDPTQKARAEEKMKEINSAYDLIKKWRSGEEREPSPGFGNNTGGFGNNTGGFGSGGYSKSGYGSGGSNTGNFGGTGHGSTGGIYYNIRVCINEGRYSDADTMLESVPGAERNAEWHFLKGCVLAQKGWYYDAINSFTTACSMDPDNMEYRNAYNTVRQRSASAQNPYNTARNSSECTVCDICNTLLCMNCLCNMCGGSC